MTFTELQAVFQREIVADQSADVWDATDDVLPLLKQASIEIAALLGFPQKIATGTLADGATTITAPTGIAAAQLGQLVVGSWDLRPVPYAEVLRQRQLFSDGIPTVYNFDPRRGGNIEIGPAVSGTPGYTLEYTVDLAQETLADGDQAWLGQFQNWHWLIPLRAGISAWRMVQEFDRVQHYAQEFQMGMQQFSAYLGEPAPELRLQQMEQPRSDAVEGA